MSYILEALKKSQRDRELGQVPDLTAEPYMDSSETRPSMGPWIIGSVLIALIALLIALYAVFGRQLGEPEAPQVQSRDPVLQQRQPAEDAASKTIERAATSVQPQEPVPSAKATVTPPPPVASTSAKPAAPAEKKLSVPKATAPAVSSASKQTKETAATVSSAQKPPSKQTEVERIRQEYARMQAREKQQKQQQEAQASTSSRPTKTAEPLKEAHPAAHELPAEVRARMPPRNIMLQSYSENPAERFVIMNSVKLHQGQSTADGLKVLEIRADGLLLEFEAYKFFQPR